MPFAGTLASHWRVSLAKTFCCKEKRYGFAIVPVVRLRSSKQPPTCFFIRTNLPKIALRVVMGFKHDRFMK
jgi:hypothetical protein